MDLKDISKDYVDFLRNVGIIIPMLVIMSINCIKQRTILNIDGHLIWQYLLKMLIRLRLR